MFVNAFPGKLIPSSSRSASVTVYRNHTAHGFCWYGIAVTVSAPISIASLIPCHVGLSTRASHVMRNSMFSPAANVWSLAGFVWKCIGAIAGLRATWWSLSSLTA